MATQKQLQEAKERAKRIADKYLAPPPPEPAPLTPLEAINRDIAKQEQLIKDMREELDRMCARRFELLPWRQPGYRYKPKVKDIPISPDPQMLKYQAIEEEIAKAAADKIKSDLIAMGLIKPKPELKRRPL